jgi:hypothetical protein
MVRIPDGLTRAELEAFRAAYVQCRKDRGLGGKTVVSYRVFFRPLPIDRPHATSLTIV